jgi:RNA polymerase sigma-70 factor (ECF subfamily)
VTGRSRDEGTEELAEAFEAQRPRLVRLAYATTGSLAEAEDCVQEAWLRLRRVADPGSIRDLGAWLTTTVSRLALDALGSARARRERYVGPWLPEPLVEDLSGTDPADRVTLDESVSMALLVVLERLSPAERTSFLLHDVFGMSFAEVAAVVGRSPAAVRQLASRARQHVDGGRPRFPPTRAQQEELLTAFAVACAGGDLECLSPCSIPAWCGAPTAAARSPRPAGSPAVRTRWRAGCCPSCAGRPPWSGWPASTAAPAWSCGTGAGC